MEVEEQKGFRLSRDVSIADIVAIVCIGLPVMLWAGKMDARLAQVEAAVISVKTEAMNADSRQNAERESLRKEIKDDLREISRKLDKLVERGK